MTVSIEDLVARIHANPRPLVLAATGGGSRAIASLLTAPGASRTVLEAIVPYASSALADFLGARPEQFCSPRTARLMAMAAWQRARRLTAGESDVDLSNLLGIGCTASLASDRPKRGAHRAFVALQSASLTATWSLEFDPAMRSRDDEEHITARLILNAIAQACGLHERLALDLAASESLETSRFAAPLQWQELLAGQRDAVRLPEQPPAVGLVRRAIFPGAFNPLHDAHRRMAQLAADKLSLPVEFEISVTNVDKPPLDYEEMQFRADQFGDGSPLWFTAAPTFVEKARLFAGATFLVGADTILRIADSRYYTGSAERCHAAIETIAAQNCRFLVFARALTDDVKSLHELPLPQELKQLCDEVPASQFRNGLSSTALRKQQR